MEPKKGEGIMKKVALIIGAMVVITSCTLSFQNIDTHGTATDLVDENQATSPNVSPVITVPVNAVPEIPIK